MGDIKRCNLCNKENFEGLYKIHDKATGMHKKFNLVKCKNCRVIFINPQPSFSQLKPHYAHDYYSYNEIINEDSSFKVRLRIFLYRLYFSKEKNIFLKILFSPFMNYLRGTSVKKGKKILDVGCGSGQFLYEMKNLKMKTFGIEPGDFDKKSSLENGLHIKKGDLISSGYPSNSFDIITANQVIEHVPNPSQILNELYRISKRKGLVIIGVPNSRSLAHMMFRENWYQLDVPRHLFHFSDTILSRELKRRGFNIIKIRHVSRPTQFTKSLRYALGIKKKQIWEYPLEVLALPFTYLLNGVKLGDSIEVWCTK